MVNSPYWFSFLAIFSGVRTRQDYGGFPKEQGLTVVLVGCCSRSTGSESGRLGVDAAVVVAEHGNLPTTWVVTTPVQFGYYAILVEVDSLRRVIWPEREGRRKKEEGKKEKGSRHFFDILHLF